jgi:hypothetical protein
MTIHLLRKQDLSIYYWLKNLFASTSFIAIQDGYPETELTTPTISIEAMDFEIAPFELGNRVGQRIRPWAIDIFALNKAQRDEYAYKIIDALENGIPVYDYDAGFPPPTPAQIGTLEPDDIEVRIIRIFPGGTQEKLFWRSSILFTTIYQPKN